MHPQIINNMRQYSDLGTHLRLRSLDSISMVATGKTFFIKKIKLQKKVCSFASIEITRRLKKKKVAFFLFWDENYFLQSLRLTIIIAWKESKGQWFPSYLIIIMTSETGSFFFISLMWKSEACGFSFQPEMKKREIIFLTGTMGIEQPSASVVLVFWHSRQ